MGGGDGARCVCRTNPKDGETYCIRATPDGGWKTCGGPDDGKQTSADSMAGADFLRLIAMGHTWRQLADPRTIE